MKNRRQRTRGRGRPVTTKGVTTKAVTGDVRTIDLAVKALDVGHPNGEFEAILSAPTKDRDGEVVAAGAFNPLPDSIPIFYAHDWREGAMPVGSARPFYDGKTLKVRGTFASTTRAQELRSLLTEGHVTSMSVGFGSPKRSAVNGVPHVTKGELLEGSFAPMPVNPAAKVLSVKSGARNNTTDLERLQMMHDLAVKDGAVCGGAAGKSGALSQARMQLVHDLAAENGAVCTPGAKNMNDDEEIRLRARALEMQLKGLAQQISSMERDQRAAKDKRVAAVIAVGKAEHERVRTNLTVLNPEGFEARGQLSGWAGMLPGVPILEVGRGSVLADDRPLVVDPMLYSPDHDSAA